jgi:hypothetical protein
MATSIERLWHAAREDAGYSATEARCYPFGGRPPGTCHWATYFQPGNAIYRTSCYPLTPGQVTDSAQYGNAHRVTIFAGARAQEVEALLRHELEHARQRDAYGDMFSIYEMILETLFNQFGGEAGVGVLYNLVPMEQDANAAAAALMYDTESPIPPAVLDGEHGVLFRHPSGPPPMPSLGPRMLAFASIYGGTFETVLQRHKKKCRSTRPVGQERRRDLARATRKSTATRSRSRRSRSHARQCRHPGGKSETGRCVGGCA